METSPDGLKDDGSGRVDGHGSEEPTADEALLVGVHDVANRPPVAGADERVIVGDESEGDADQTLGIDDYGVTERGQNVAGAGGNVFDDPAIPAEGAAGGKAGARCAESDGAGVVDGWLRAESGEPLAHGVGDILKRKITLGNRCARGKFPGQRQDER